MKVLSVNAGSSTVKFQLYDMPLEKVLVASTFERIGLDKSFYRIEVNGEKIKKEAFLPTHEEAVKIFLQELINLKVIDKLEDIEGIGHRVVHGGDKYSDSVIINDEVIRDIESFSSLAPLHNPANLLGINVIKKLLPNSKNIAVFDTAFHQTMESDAYIYPIPYEWYTTYGVRKYGFHGTSHKYMSERISDILGRRDLKIITCHLGGGCSIAAIKNGKSIDTSMGFTPMGGIPMGTRCGDIDPSIIEYIMKSTNKTIEQVTKDLNKNSGFLGLNGVSSDYRDNATEILNGNERCILAQRIFVRKIASFIAMYNMLLDGADAIAFSGGIGENVAMVREEIATKLGTLGVIIDKERNNVSRIETLISSDNSKIKCYIIPADEELMIAKDTYKLIERFLYV